MLLNYDSLVVMERSAHCDRHHRVSLEAIWIDCVGKDRVRETSIADKGSEVDEVLLFASKMGPSGPSESRFFDSIFDGVFCCCCSCFQGETKRKCCSKLSGVFMKCCHV